jgi:3-oxoacyl-[acyl-carrier-protein] synthase III
MLQFKIAGCGHYVPKNVVDNSHFEQYFSLPLGTISRKLGVDKRHHSTSETTVDMAVFASRLAIQSAGLEATDIQKIILASAAPQQAIPCTAVFVQSALGITDGTCFSFDINATCISFLVAFQVAINMLNGSENQNILICSSEISSINLNQNDLETAPLFGDGAGSIILSSKGSSVYCGASFATFSSGKDSSQFLGGGTLYHPNNLNTKPEHYQFSMDGRKLLRVAISELPDFFYSFLNTLGWSIEDIDLIIPHQASKHGLEILYRVLKINPNKVFRNLELYGNCVAASIPIALSEAVAKNLLKPGSKVILLGVAAGISMGAIGFIV